MPRAAESWRAAAERWREALRLLDWDSPPCLPGEALGAGCGGTDAEHAISYLGGILAAIEHKLAHLDEAGRAIAEAVHDDMAGELAALDAARPCGQEGHGHASS